MLGSGASACTICSASACVAGQYLSGCGGALAGTCVACPAGSYSSSSGKSSHRINLNLSTFLIFDLGAILYLINLPILDAHKWNRRFYHPYDLCSFGSEYLRQYRHFHNFKNWHVGFRSLCLLCLQCLGLCCWTVPERLWWIISWHVHKLSFLELHHLTRQGFTVIWLFIVHVRWYSTDYRAKKGLGHIKIYILS